MPCQPRGRRRYTVLRIHRSTAYRSTTSGYEVSTGAKRSFPPEPGQERETDSAALPLCIVILDPKLFDSPLVRLINTQQWPGPSGWTFRKEWGARSAPSSSMWWWRHQA